MEGGAMKALSARDPLVLGRFRLLGRLGAGGMGRVYLGRGPAGELVAVKMMHTRIADDPGFRGRFASEVAISQKIDSPGVARLVDVAAVIDADLDAPHPWVASWFVTGPSPSQAVQATGALGGVPAGLLALRLTRVLRDDLVDRLADLTDVVDAAWPSFYHDLWMREFSSGSVDLVG